MTEVYSEIEIAKSLFASKTLIRNKHIISEENSSNSILVSQKMTALILLTKKFGINLSVELYETLRFSEACSDAFQMILSPRFLILSLSNKSMPIFQGGLLNPKTFKAMS